MSLSTLLGWVFIGLSWAAPKLIKQKENKLVITMVLCGISVGIFIGYAFKNINI